MDHKPLESYLGRYGGLMLYLKEMDEAVYGKLCAVCGFSIPSEHSTSRILGVFLCREQFAHGPDQSFPVCMQHHGQAWRRR